MKTNKETTVQNAGAFLVGGKRKMNKYQAGKERARAAAIEWQHTTANEPMSCAELYEWGEYFRRLARRYGLTAEFVENGII